MHLVEHFDTALVIDCIDPIPGKHHEIERSIGEARQVAHPCSTRLPWGYLR